MKSSQAGTGCVSHREEFDEARCQRKSGATQYVRIGRGSPSSKGNRGAPSQSSGGAIIISNRCCSMWTCSSKDVNGSIGDARARKSADRPAPNATGRLQRPASPHRGDAARASRAGRRRPSAGARRGATDRTARSAGRRRTSGSSRPRCRHGGLIAAGRAGSWPCGRRLTRNSTRAVISAGFICLP